jgi:hypothetical protein
MRFDENRSHLSKSDKIIIQILSPYRNTKAKKINVPTILRIFSSHKLLRVLGSLRPKSLRPKWTTTEFGTITVWTLLSSYVASCRLEAFTLAKIKCLKGNNKVLMSY